MDDLGNRVGSNTIRTGGSSSPVSYVLDIATPDDDTDDTNRYLTIGGNRGKLKGSGTFLN